MFKNKRLLHWKDWPTALPNQSLPPIAPPSLTPPLTCGLYKRKPSRAHTHTLLSSTTTPFAKELGPLLR